MTTIKIRRDTAANWTANNPILATGEPGLETDTKKIKYGDGSTAWNSLAYPTAGVTSYNDLTNKPSLFSGSYNDLTNKPSLFSGSYNDLTNKPSLFSGSYTDLTNTPNLATVATSGSYNDLTDKPSGGSLSEAYINFSVFTAYGNGKPGAGSVNIIAANNLSLTVGTSSQSYNGMSNNNVPYITFPAGTYTVVVTDVVVQTSDNHNIQWIDANAGNTLSTTSGNSQVSLVGLYSSAKVFRETPFSFTTSGTTLFCTASTNNTSVTWNPILHIFKTA